MAFFELISDITVGSFNFSGAHEVRVKRSMRTLQDSCTITLPARGGVLKNGRQVEADVVMAQKFNEGDGVHVNLGYNGDVNNEFVGFVRSIGTGRPLVLECEGYVRELRLNCDFNKHYAKTTAKEMLQLACQGTDITVQCPVYFPLCNFTLQHANGEDICNYVKEASDHMLSIFFVEPKVLFCGLTYLSYATANPLFGLPTVDYRVGYNCVRDNGLKKRVPKERVQIIMKGRTANGNFVKTASKDKTAANKVKTLHNHVPDDKTLGMFAQEKEYQLNYTGYEGPIPGFLYPYALPGFDAHVVNTDMPELNGKYLIEETDVTFGMRGARRHVKVGARVGFDS